MSYNFKSIADTQIVAEPAESVHVLIEENGEIKRVLKTAVGGGETNSYFIVVTESDSYNCPFVTPGIYNAITNLLNNYVPFKLTVIGIDEDAGDGDETFEFIDINTRFHNSGNDYYYTQIGVYCLEIHSDDTARYYYND